MAYGIDGWASTKGVVSSRVIPVGRFVAGLIAPQ